MYYYLYEITNILNNKIYIGVHKTENLNDGYFGSGFAICEAIKKYGKKNFNKKILKFFQNEKEMFDNEAEIVNSSFIKEDSNYNLKEGGVGFTKESSALANEKRTILLKNDKVWKEEYSKKLSESINNRFSSDFEKNEYFEKIRNICKEKKAGFAYNEDIRKEMVKRSLSEEAKSKRLKTLKEIKHQQGSKNSNFGKCWIYNEEEKSSILIKKDDLNEYTLKGWKKGRKMFSTY